MGSTEAQSRDEANFIRLFIDGMKIEAVPDPQPQGTGPDFILRGISPEVGVEVREVYREKPAAGAPMRQAEGVNESILRGADECWNAAGGEPVEVWVHFKKIEKMPTKARVAELAETIANLVRDANLEVGGCAVVRSGESPQSLPEEIHSVVMARPCKLQRSVWHLSGAAFESELSEDQLQSEIDTKNKKYARIYESGERTNWLLLVMDGSRHSGTHEVSKKVVEHQYSSRFERTFLLDTFSKKVVELNTVQPEGDIAGELS